jgi:hypothetical protein
MTKLLFSSEMMIPLSEEFRQPGDLGVLRGVAGGVAEEARTRGFASLTLVRFAFIVGIVFPREVLVNSGLYLAQPRANHYFLSKSENF